MKMNQVAKGLSCGREDELFELREFQYGTFAMVSFVYNYNMDKLCKDVRDDLTTINLS